MPQDYPAFRLSTPPFGDGRAAYINRIATGVPSHEVHTTFRRFAESLIGGERRKLALFRRMAERSGIEHRYSHLRPSADPGGASLDADSFYARGAFPSTAARMQVFNRHAPRIAVATVDRLLEGYDRHSITHLLVTCCTGFAAPGVDFEIVMRCGLRPSIERTMIGFMGCQAALNALKCARHIVRSEPTARVLVVNVELCTLHLKETTDLEEMLSFLLFGDGCAASLVTGEPVGIALDGFTTTLIPDTAGLITWHVRDSGFDMVLSGLVPGALRQGLRFNDGELLAGLSPTAIDLWAVHPGGRTILDAVERALDLPPEALSASRDVLRHYGNMSSPTVMFVLERLLRSAVPGATGCALSFGPGLTAEAMRFRVVTPLDTAGATAEQPVQVSPAEA